MGGIQQADSVGGIQRADFCGWTLYVDKLACMQMNHHKSLLCAVFLQTNLAGSVKLPSPPPLLPDVVTAYSGRSS